MMLHIELVSQIESRDAFARSAAEWLSTAKDLVFPGFDDALSGGLVPFDPPPPPEGYWMLGKPTALKANIYVQRQALYTLGRRATYSKRSWQKLVEGLSEAYPYSISLLFSMVDDNGANAGWGTSASLAVHRAHDAPEFVRFEAGLPQGIVPWRGDAEFQMKWAAFAREWSMRTATCSGHISGGAGSLWSTPEAAADRYARNVAAFRGEPLSEYSWVTVCPAALAGRLGGLAGLRQTGAFYAVTEVADGSVFLQATPTLDEYDEAAMRRVHEAFGPVLAEGGEV